MSHKAQIVIDDVEWILQRIKPIDKVSRNIIRRLLHIIDTVEYFAEDYADVESELDLMKRQYANYPPMPLDDDWYDDYYEKYEKEDED